MRALTQLFSSRGPLAGSLRLGLGAATMTLWGSCAALERGDPSPPDAGAVADTTKTDTASPGGKDAVSGGDSVAGGDGASTGDDTTIVEEDTAAPATSFAASVHPILVAGCTSAGCHGSGAGGYTISGSIEADYSAALDRVVPGDPDGSKLLKKASGVSSHSGGPLLTPGTPDYDVVAAWIREGAAP